MNLLLILAGVILICIGGFSILRKSESASADERPVFVEAIKNAGIQISEEEKAKIYSQGVIFGQSWAYSSLQENSEFWLKQAERNAAFGYTVENGQIRTPTQ